MDARYTAIETERNHWWVVDSQGNPNAAFCECGNEAAAERIAEALNETIDTELEHVISARV